MSGTFKQFLFPLLAGFALMLLVHAQDQTGFISIDCGLQENSGYPEPKTTIYYISDATYIDTGERKSVSPENRKNNPKPYWSLRSFPHGTRNCYKINVENSTKYLIRASFFYGNYDGETKLPKFDLHLGPNLWDSVSFADASTTTNKELIHLVPADRNYLHVCLVETGSGVPFISAIELRPLPNTTYLTQMGSLLLYKRYDTGQVGDKFNRYPDDIHDRFWNSNDSDDWTQLIYNGSTIDLDDNSDYQPANIVMSTAAMPIYETDNLTFYWEPEDESAEYYIYMHFAEVEELPDDETRHLVVTWNGELFGNPFNLEYLKTYTLPSESAMSGGQYNFSIGNADAYSSLPPILNAYEIYRVKEFSSEQETNQDDVNAITNIKLTYKIEKNWQGDPCSPKNYSWEGLNCSYSPNHSPRIISLNLSSSGLIGQIDASISNLTMIQTLDLSNNELKGPIPDFLSQMSNLNVLNLENNKLTGSIPNGLVERRKNGLQLSLCDNSNLIGNVSCKKKRKRHGLMIYVIGSIIGISILLLIVAIIFWRLKKKRPHAIILGAGSGAQPPIGSMELEPTRRQFPYSEILKFTNNKQRILGKGGFGTVYHGYLDNKTQVAIKLLSPSSSRGLEQFHAEVNLLMRVHHTNLTSLIGYCDDGTNKGLVYEYMARGNLQEYLSGLATRKFINS